MLVDKMGLPFAIKVTAGNVSDNKAGILAVGLLREKVPGLVKIAADKGYKNAFANMSGPIFRGPLKLHKSQNRARASSRKRTAGPLKGVLVGQISGAGCSKR